MKGIDDSHSRENPTRPAPPARLILPTYTAVIPLQLVERPLFTLAYTRTCAAHNLISIHVLKVFLKCTRMKRRQRDYREMPTLHVTCISKYSEKQSFQWRCSSYNLKKKKKNPLNKRKDICLVLEKTMKENNKVSLHPIEATINRIDPNVRSKRFPAQL